MTDRQTDRHKIDSLTGARFAAILIIVFSHFEFLGGYGQFGDIYWRFFHNPTMGVDFFFMLSGFGMMLSSIKQDPDGVSSIGGIRGLISFGKKHVSKIYPVYLGFLLLGFPCSLILGHYESGHSIWALLVKNCVFFAVDLTLLQSVTGIMAFSHSLNPVCWFLSSLFCIYLISPIVLKFIKKRVKTIRMSVLGLIVTVLISFFLALAFSWMDNNTFFNDLCYGSPYRRVFYVITGMLVARIYSIYNTNGNNVTRYPRFINKGFFEYVFIGLSIIWFFLRFSCVNALGDFVYIVDMIFVSGDLFALAVSKGRISKLFSNRMVVFLGEISMYIFLSHYIIRNYIQIIMIKFNLHSFLAAIIEVLAVLILSLITSVIIYQYRIKSKRRMT